MAQWRVRIDAAFSFGQMDRRGFAHYHGVEDWLDCVSPVIDALGDLAAAGQHEAAAELAEQAYQRTDLAMGELYDEDGSLMMIAQQLADLHYRACGQGQTNCAISWHANCASRVTREHPSTCTGKPSLPARR
ncbi:MAG: hypothetical protein F4Z53_15175 [Acidimicrobiales bacterium]|nr:hypothetical protein [Acidimicrobiales bacterium]MYD32509.1 hypothetical protein [Acidimicrobiales bacterium]MYI08993.1 hypothetical protein [Acidimicrobiales bacterium]